MDDTRIFYIYKIEVWEEYPVGYITGELNAKKYVKSKNELFYRKYKKYPENGKCKFYYEELKELSLQENKILNTGINDKELKTVLIEICKKRLL